MIRKFDTKKSINKKVTAKKELSYDDLSPSVKKAIEDAELGRNLIGPFDTVDEMFKYVLGDDYDLQS